MKLKEFEKWRENVKIGITYFSFPECNVCKVLLPKVKDLVSAYEEPDLIYIDVQKFPETAGQCQVFQVPTIIIFSDAREIKRFSRFFAIAELQEYLDKITRIF